MHIPDGLLAPNTYLPALAVALPLWFVAIRRVAAELDEALIPRLAVVTAAAFVLTTLMIPLPGGSSAHLVGVPLLALLFGWWTAFLAYSAVLLLQTLLLGTGGITALPVNALAMGGVGAAVTLSLWRLLGARHRRRAGAPPVPGAPVIIATVGGIVAAAAVLAGVLGLQPVLARDADGAPLFFPFPMTITLPALVLPHLIIGLGEGVVTWIVLRQLAWHGWGGVAAAEAAGLDAAGPDTDGPDTADPDATGSGPTGREVPRE